MICAWPTQSRLSFEEAPLMTFVPSPLAAKREAGHQLDQVQNGRDPDDWKPMNTVGQGVKEIRIRDAAGAFRVIYVAKFADAVYVLHCFQKKTEKTNKTDLNMAASRYRDLLKEVGS